MSFWIENFLLKHQLKGAIETLILEECGVKTEVTRMEISQHWGGRTYKAYTHSEIKILDGEISNYRITLHKPISKICGDQYDYVLNESSNRFGPSEGDTFYKWRGASMHFIIFIFLIMFGPVTWFILRMFKQ